MYLVSAEQMRLIDKTTIEEFGIPGRILMENAGREAAKIFAKTFEKSLNKKIAVAAGAGNNGGDGFVIARCLNAYGCDVTLFLFSNPKKIKGEAKDNLKLLQPLNIPTIIADTPEKFNNHKKIMDTADIWIDAILGTGLKYQVKEHIKNVIEYINSLKKPIFAIDISSGLNSDTGLPNGTSIIADYTVAFGLAKTGQKLYPGAKYTGKLKVADIGIPPHIIKKASLKTQLITADYIKSKFLQKEPDTHKGDCGHLLVIAGSAGKTGAAILTAKAAVRSGTGLVTIAIPKSINPIVESCVTEAMTYPLPETSKKTIKANTFNIIKKLLKGKNCIAIGPGLGTENNTKKLIYRLIEDATLPMVIDADALNAISGNPEVLKKAKAPLILTPHPKEMARLIKKDTSYVCKDKINAAKNFAGKYNAILILKGAGTVIAMPNGSVFINSTGNQGMASGGTGDVLTGIIAGFISQGYTPDISAIMGVYMHGAAGDAAACKKGFVGLIASDIIEALPYEIKKLEHRLNI
ncbi:MAG: NAD(P)H-hydrate dehydratase [Deltaproteobacteria bacterium]|nr:NAD(P)H-hydrate dehydratase [Deltaproteobacteria bacterium]